MQDKDTPPQAQEPMTLKEYLLLPQPLATMNRSAGSQLRGRETEVEIQLHPLSASHTPGEEQCPHRRRGAHKGAPGENDGHASLLPNARPDLSQ